MTENQEVRVWTQKGWRKQTLRAHCNPLHVICKTGESFLPSDMLLKKIAAEFSGVWKCLRWCTRHHSDCCVQTSMRKRDSKLRLHHVGKLEKSKNWKLKITLRSRNYFSSLQPVASNNSKSMVLQTVFFQSYNLLSEQPAIALHVWHSAVDNRWVYFQKWLNINSLSFGSLFVVLTVFRR